MFNQSKRDVDFQNRQFRGYNLDSKPTNIYETRNLSLKMNETPRMVSFSTGKAPITNTRGARGEPEGSSTLQGLPSFSNFVKLYSNKYGLNYKEALKDEGIKDLYRQNIKTSNDSGILSTPIYSQKHFAKNRDSRELVRQDEAHYIDNRFNNDSSQFVKTNFNKNNMSSIQNLQISRGLFNELKTSFFDYLRVSALPDQRREFNKSHNASNFNQLSLNIIETLIRKVYSKKSVLFECSPFSEILVYLNSKPELQTLKTKSESKLIEACIDNIQQNIIDKLQPDESSIIEDDETVPIFIDYARLIEQSDVFYINYSTMPTTIFQNRLSQSTRLKKGKRFDFYFTCTDKLNSESDLFSKMLDVDFIKSFNFNDENSEKLYNLMISDRDTQVLNIQDENFEQFQINNERNINDLIDTLANEGMLTRGILENMITSKSSQDVKSDQPPSTPIPQAIAQQIPDKPQPTDVLYYNTRTIGNNLQKGDVIVNKTGNVFKYVDFITTLGKKANDRTSIIYLKPDGSTDTDAFINSSYRVVTKPLMRRKGTAVSVEQLRKYLPEKVIMEMLFWNDSDEPQNILSPEMEAVLNQPPTPMRRLVLDEDFAESSEQGQGFRTHTGGNAESSSKLLKEFRNKFNPKLFYVGSSGIEHLHLLRF